MDGIKAWYQSKAVWGGLIAVAASLAQLGGVSVGNDVQADLAELAVTLSGAIGGLVAIYGRIVANANIMPISGDETR